MSDYEILSFKVGDEFAAAWKRVRADDAINAAALRSVAPQTVLKYCQTGGPVGIAQIDRSAIMSWAKSFAYR